LFVEVVVAPQFDEDALETFRAKKNLRVVPLPFPPTATGADFKRRRGRFAAPSWAAVKSNAILLARAEAAIAIGGGQMSRVDASFLAVHKARQQGHDPAGRVVACCALLSLWDG